MKNRVMRLSTRSLFTCAFGMMNLSPRNVNHKLFYVFKRFLSANIKHKVKHEWLEPTGHKTDINIYNPITKRVTPLILKNKDVLTWYSCGPTVYDSAHIGHAVTYVKSDIIRRIINDFFNIHVVMAMCITDIDDKIIQRAQEKNTTIQDLTKHYEDEFFSDMKQLNVLPPTLYCRVTDYIPEIVNFIQNIFDKDMAYLTEDGSIYFDTSKSDKYVEVIEPMVDSSVEDTPNLYKKAPSDFCLWKAAKENEPFWPSLWGPGRPGWHIECSTIASMIFGKSIDIHSGGIDLAFPHHENEETQSCCYHDVGQWVNYWLRFGHLFLSGDVKMSKSLKNTVSIQEFLEQYSANEFRMLCLLSEYRHGIEFSHDVITKATITLKSIENFIGDCDNYMKGKNEFGNVDESSLLQCLSKTKESINSHLANNFNTAEAIHSIIDLIKHGNKMLSDKNVEKTRSNAVVGAVANYISSTMTKLGISKSAAIDDSNFNNIIDEFVKFRNLVRVNALAANPKNKDLLSACDHLRSQLQTHGITLKDSKENCTWVMKRY